MTLVFKDPTFFFIPLSFLPQSPIHSTYLPLPSNDSPNHHSFPSRDPHKNVIIPWHKIKNTIKPKCKPSGVGCGSHHYWIWFFLFSKGDEIHIFKLYIYGGNEQWTLKLVDSCNGILVEVYVYMGPCYRYP